MLSSSTIVGARGDRLVDLLEAVALDLDRATRPAVARALDRVGDADAGEVVVLHQHEVGQRPAVVDAAAGAHRRLLERAQTGQRLAGVPDPRTRRRPRRRSDG